MFWVQVGDVYLNLDQIAMVEFCPPGAGRDECWAEIRVAGDSDALTLRLDDPDDVDALRLALRRWLTEIREQTDAASNCGG